MQTAPSEMDQAMQHATTCGCQPIPTEQEARQLYDAVSKGDAIAMEKVVKLYHNMVKPATAPERQSLSMIFEAYSKFIKPNLNERL